MLIAINQDSTYSHLHAKAHTQKKKKKHLNFSKHYTPCILTRRVCAFAMRGAAGGQPSSGRLQPGPPQALQDLPLDPQQGKRWGKSRGGGQAPAPHGLSSACPRGGHRVTGSARRGSGHPNRMPAETRRCFRLPTFGGGSDLSLSKGSGCLHISQKQPQPNPSAQRSAPFPNLRGGP